MLLASDVIALDQLNCVVHYVDGSTDNFILQPPNGDGMFKYRISNIQDAHYRDANNFRRKGYRDVEINLEFNYSSHKMPIFKLYVSQYVEIDFGSFPVPFTNRDFKFMNNSLLRNWFNNLAMRREISEADDRNEVPFGEITLEFTSVRRKQ